MPSPKSWYVSRVDESIDPTRLKKILVVGCRLLGDALLSSHVVKSLMGALPGVSFDLLAPAYSQNAYAWLGPWRRMIVTPSIRAMAREIRREKYDLAFILPGGFQWAFFAWRAGIPHRVGHSGDHRQVFLTGHARPTQSVANYRNFMNLLGTLPFGVPEREAVPPMGEAPLPPPYLVLAPGASEVAKMWPDSAWIHLASRLRGQGLGQIVWLGSAGEESLLSRLAGASGDLVCPGIFSFEKLCHLMSHARLFVGNNSGLSHLAGLCHTPTAVLTGPSDPIFTRPFGKSVRMIYLDDPRIPVHRRGEKRHRNRIPMGGISVEMVWRALEEEGWV